MTSILSARNIVKKYATKTALQGINLEIPEKSIFGLLGPNGAGKTTFIRIINQIIAPDSGEIFFNNEPLKQQHIGQIGYLPEERGLYKKMKVGEQALYLARLKGLEKQEALKKLKYWFEKFEMQTWWNKKVEELSKGMQQKVQFVVTVLHEPRLLILDEPFSGFDPINANIIRNEILELRKKGSTIIFSTHNMGSVEELCDNIALINKSEKILDGSVKEIRKQFRTNIFEIEFNGSIIGFTNALWAGAELIEKEQEGEYCKVKLKLLGNNTANDLLGAVLPLVKIVSFRELFPSMNDIFISMVGEEKAVGTQSNYTE